MATLYAHAVNDTLESSEPSNSLVHSRNLSTVSSVTLHTSTTSHSQPYEPLLRPITPGSGEYYDVASHQSRNSDRILSLPRWSQSNVMSHNPSIVDEKKAYSERTPPKRVKLLRWSKQILEIVMATWAIYSTARYLLAFTIYQSVTGQAFSIVLGACTGLSFAFASCATILSMAQTSLLIHGFSVQALISLRSTLQYLSSCCFLGPSIVNIVLILVWKKTSDLELHTRHRCRLDVDLVWSTRYSLCNHKTHNWGAWITLAAIRAILTLVIIITFHLIASSSQFVPVRRPKSRHAKGKKSHVRLESDQTPLMHGNSNSSVVMPQLNRDPILQHQTSDSTLSAKSSPRNRLRPTRSHSSAFFEEGLQSEVPSYNNAGFLPMNGDHHEPDRELSGFVDRFRSLISQITRETEEGLAFARSDNASSSLHDSDSPTSNSAETDIEIAHQHPHDDYDDEDGFYSASPAHAIVSSEYHQPYPADESVRMMNGYIRRMPTIESMGSHEMKSSLGASSMNTNRDRDRAGASRPPTRNTLISWVGTDLTGSEPRSRSNSLTAQAELLVGMFGRAHASEIGELMNRGGTVGVLDSPTENDDISEALGDDYDSSTGSKDTTQSFHTATTGTVNSMNVALTDASQSPLPIPLHLQSPEVGSRSHTNDPGS